MTLRAGKINILFLMIRMEMGGSERLVYNLARHLDRTVFNPSIGWFYGGPVLKEFSELDVDLFHIPKLKNIDFASMQHIARIVKDKDIHIVNTHHFMPLIYALYGTQFRGKRRLLGTFHSKWEIDALPFKWRVMSRFLLQRPDGVIGVSEDVSGAAEKVFGLSRSKIFTFLNGVDIEAFGLEKERGPTREKIGLSASDKVIGVIANLKKVKNHLFLLQAFHELSRECENAKLLLIGRGFNDPDNTEDEIRDFISAKGLSRKVVLLGQRSDIPELLQTMDVYCLTSFKEGLPISVIEAMASGLPIVGTDVEGIRDVVMSDHNGFLVDLNDVQGLKNALGRLLKDEELRRRFGDASRLAAMERYSLKKSIKEYEQLFSSLCTAAKQEKTPVQGPSAHS